MDLEVTRNFKLQWGGELYYEWVKGADTDYLAPYDRNGQLNFGLLGILRCPFYNRHGDNIPVYDSQNPANTTYVPGCRQRFVLDSDRLAYGLFVALDYKPHEKLRLSAGVRLQHGVAGNLPYDPTPLYAAAAVWNIYQELYLKVNYATGADGRDDPGPPEGHEGRGAGAGLSSSSRWSGIPNAGDPPQELPAPVLGRHAAARHDRHGARPPAEAPHRGRADDRARRDDPGAGARAPRGPHDEAGDRAHPHHPRPRRRRRDDTADQCHVRGLHRRDRRRRAISSPIRRTRTPSASSIRSRAIDAEADEKLIPIEGRPPDMRRAPAGCPFAPRCAWRVDACWTENPGLEPLDEGTRAVASGPNATHRIACFNRPTANEVRGGRPLRDGFVAAPPPPGMMDELAQLQSPSTDDFGGSSPASRPRRVRCPSTRAPAACRCRPSRSTAMTASERDPVTGRPGFGRRRARRGPADGASGGPSAGTRRADASRSSRSMTSRSTSRSARGSSSSATSAMSGRSTGSRSRCAGARRSASSASPAAGRARPGARSSASTSRPAAASCSTASTPSRSTSAA